MEKLIDGFGCINVQAELKPLVMAVKAPVQGWLLLQEVQPWEVLVLPTKPAAPSQLPAQGFCRARQCAGHEAKGFVWPPSFWDSGEEATGFGCWAGGAQAGINHLEPPRAGQEGLGLFWLALGSGNSLGAPW